MTFAEVNPYIAGAPLRKTQGFFGREETLEWVKRELRNPATNALVLFGQRRIGKTSLLLLLQNTLATEDFLPVYFDLQDQATRPLGQVLYDLADTIADRIGVERPVTGNFDDRGVFFRKTTLPQLYAALGETRRPVFLLDEFDVLDQMARAELPETAAAKSLFPFLRRLMTEDTRPAFVFVVGRRAEDLALDFTATFKSSLVQEVWTLDRASAEALVRQAEVNGTLRFTGPAIERILQLTSQHPYLTQLLCQRIWERAYEDRPESAPVVDQPEVEAAITDTLETGNQALVWLWNGLSPAEKIYAAALAEFSEEGVVIREDDIVQVLSAHATRLRTREVEMAPRDLVRRHVLEAAGEREYRFAVELFRRWVRQHKPLRDVKDELDQLNPMAEQLFGLGQGFFKRRQWAIATRYFRDSLLINTRHFRSRLHLGEALLEMGQTEEAVAELEKAYELDHDEARLPLARALMAQAKVRSQMGEEEGALQAAERALQFSPNERAAHELRTAIWTRRGDAALAQEKYQVAIAAYREAGLPDKAAQTELTQRRQALQAIADQAVNQAAKKNWPEAETLYEQLVGQAPDDQSRTKWQNDLARTREEQELAQLFREGTQAMAKRHWSQAHSAFSEVVRRRPDYVVDGQSAERLLRRAAAEADRRANPRPIPVWVWGVASIVMVSTLIVGATLMANGLGVPTSTAGIDATTSPPPVTEPGPTTPSVTEVTALPLTEIPSDTPTEELPTETPTPEVPLALDGTPVLIPLVAIRPDTVEQVMPLARWGRGVVKQIAWSPDGAWVAVGTSLGVYLYDGLTGEEVRLIETGSTVDSLAFSVNSEEIATASQNAAVVLVWRVIDGMLLHQLEGHEAGVTGVAFSPDRIRLASSSADGTVIFWDAGTGERLGDPLTLNLITSLAFSPSDGATLALGADDGSVYLWDVANNQQKAEFLGAQGGRVVSLTFSPTDPNLLASAGGEAVILWDVGQRADRLVHPFGPFVLQDNFVSSVAFSPDGRLLAMGAYGAVQLRSVEDGSELWTTTYPTDLDQNGPVYLAFAPADPNTLITASEDGQVYLRQVAKGGEVSNELSQFSTGVSAVAISTDGRTVAASSEKGVTRVWGVDSGDLLQSLDYPAQVLAPSPDGQWLATGVGTEVKLWSAESGELVWVQNQHGGDVLSLAFSPDGSTLASGSTEDWIYLWNVASSESLGVLQENASDILSLAFSADGSLLAAGAEEGAVWLWNLGDGTVNGVLTEADTASPLRDVAFSPDGSQVLAVSDDGLLHQWQVANGASLGPLPFLWEGVPVAPLRTGFSPDGALVAGGLYTGEVLVWQLGPELTLKAILVGHTAKVESLAFASNGLLLVSGSDDGTLRLWGVRP